MNAQSSQAARNYFHLFSLEESFDLDLNALKKDFRALQQKYHPDQFINATESEKLAAVKQSSLLNDGFAVLSKPSKRAAYLLELAGLDITQNRKIDTEILVEQISFREELESLENIENHSEKEKSLEDFLDTIQIRFEQACLSFSELYSNYKKGKSSLEDLKQALSQILFFDKLLLEINKALEQLD